MRRHVRRDGSHVMRIVVVPGVVMRMLMFVMISVCCYDVSMLSIVPPIMFVAQRINRKAQMFQDSAKSFLDEMGCVF